MARSVQIPLRQLISFCSVVVGKVSTAFLCQGLTACNLSNAIDCLDLDTLPFLGYLSVHIEDTRHTVKVGYSFEKDMVWGSR